MIDSLRMHITLLGSYLDVGKKKRANNFKLRRRSYPIDTEFPLRTLACSPANRAASPVASSETLCRNLLRSQLR
jgi:hypothetical protein